MKPLVTPKDAPLLLRLRRAGVRFPLITVREARRAGLEISVLCAVLEQETAGGHNEWGHDPTIFIGGKDAHHGIAYGEEPVTKKAYLAYKAQRGPSGHGGMQGVGPMQLTFYSLQDRADELGGCWQPAANIRVGAEMLAHDIRRSGLHAALKEYNGSERYALEVEGRLPKWRRIVSG